MGVCFNARWALVLISTYVEADSALMRGIR